MNNYNGEYYMLRHKGSIRYYLSDVDSRGYQALSVNKEVAMKFNSIEEILTSAYNILDFDIVNSNNDKVKVEVDNEVVISNILRKLKEDSKYPINSRNSSYSEEELENMAKSDYASELIEFIKNIM